MSEKLFLKISRILLVPTPHGYNTRYWKNIDSVTVPRFRTTFGHHAPYYSYVFISFCVNFGLNINAISCFKECKKIHYDTLLWLLIN